MENLKQFIGRKAKGVRFQNHEYDSFNFNSKMEEFVGVEGIIKEYCEDAQGFNIDFNYKCWWYPAELILPQLMEGIIGYVINDEKYIKIIASLCDMDESILKKMYGNFHFSASSDIEEVVKKFDLLDKCTPVYKEHKKPQLPIINEYEGKDMGSYLQYGCAHLPKSWFSSSDNRSIQSLTLNSGVVINEEQMSEIREYLDSLRE